MHPSPCTPSIVHGAQGRRTGSWVTAIGNRWLRTWRLCAGGRRSAMRGRCRAIAVGRGVRRIRDGGYSSAIALSLISVAFLHPEVASTNSGYERSWRLEKHTRQCNVWNPVSRYTPLDVSQGNR